MISKNLPLSSRIHLEKKKENRSKDGIWKFRALPLVAWILRVYPVFLELIHQKKESSG